MSSPSEWEPAPPADGGSGPAPMGIGAVLDVGLRIIRRRWAVLLGIAVVFVGPGALLTAATSFRFNEVAADIIGPDAEVFGGDILTQAEFERLVGALVPALIAVFIAGLIAAVGLVATSAVVGADFYHRPMRFGAAVRVGLGRALSALAFIVVTTILVVLLLIGALLLMALALLILGGGALDQGGPGIFAALVIGVGLVVALAWLTMRWAPALPAMANEDLGWRAAMRRSGHLSGDNLWRIFVVWLVATIVTALLGAVVTQLLAIVLVDVIAASLGLDGVIAESLALALGTVLLAPLLPVLMAVLYFDLRVRRDPPGSLTS